MELSPRKKAIISEIVKAHIETGEPIGSKILATRMANAPSTATLRNEMSELCDLGYLEQPHTSAGRLPTGKAYRLYVSELMGKSTLSDEGREIIDNMLDSVRPDPETLATSAAEILSELTGLPCIAASGVQAGARLKKVSLMPMSRTSAIVFIISEDGRTRSRLVRSQTVFTQELVNLFESIAANKVCGKDISLLDMAYLQSIVVSAGLDALSLAPLFSCVFDMAGELKNSRVNMGGTANLFSICPTDTQARQILDILRTSDAVQSIFSGITSPVGVVFGDDTNYSELAPTGMVVATYGDGKELGRIAVIGPTRMAYDSILPSVEYLAKRVGKIMTELLTGLED
jgi:heat-inducible transcriptional repressor